MASDLFVTTSLDDDEGEAAATGESSSSQSSSTTRRGQQRGQQRSSQHNRRRGKGKPSSSTNDLVSGAVLLPLFSAAPGDSSGRSVVPRPSPQRPSAPPPPTAATAATSPSWHWLLPKEARHTAAEGGAAESAIVVPPLMTAVGAGAIEGIKAAVTSEGSKGSGGGGKLPSAFVIFCESVKHAERSIEEMSIEEMSSIEEMRSELFDDAALLAMWKGLSPASKEVFRKEAKKVKNAAWRSRQKKNSASNDDDGDGSGAESDTTGHNFYTEFFTNEDNADALFEVTVMVCAKMNEDKAAQDNKATAGAVESTAATGGMDDATWTYLCTAGRLLGLSIRHAVPLGVVLPTALWFELMSNEPFDPRFDAPPSDQQKGKASASGGGDGVGDGRGSRQAGHRQSFGGKATKKNKNGKRRGNDGESESRSSGSGGSQLDEYCYAPWGDYCLHDNTYRRSMAKLLEMKKKVNDDGTGEGAAGAASASSSDAIADLGLTFSVTEEEEAEEAEDEEEEEPNVGGGGGGAAVKRSTVELVPGGDDIPVTSGNVDRYVLLACRRRLLRGCDTHIAALRCGLLSVLPRSILNILSPKEAADVVSGPLVVDVAAWRESTTYDRHLGPSHPLVHMFWQTVQDDLSESERRQLLLFWSGTPVAPVFGFAGTDLSADDEQWTIRRLPVQEMGNSPRARRAIEANGHAMESVKNCWCPEASTCDRTLRLPLYDTREALLKALRIALHHGAVGYDRV
jgi:hypothetical protein